MEVSKKQINEIVKVLKQGWINDFGSLQSEQKFCGYTMAGFVEIVLMEKLKSKKLKP
jgi:hypothetical protein